MNDYIVTLDNGQLYRFTAEDALHAQEQAEDAEPLRVVMEVAQLEPLIIVSVEGGLADVTVVRGDVTVLQWDWDVIEETTEAWEVQQYIDQAEQMPDGYPAKADILTAMRAALDKLDVEP